MHSNSPVARRPSLQAKTARGHFFLLLAAALATLLVVGCKNGGGGGSDELDDDLFSERDGDDAESHWDTLNETTGPYISIAIFENGTGQIGFVNGDFDPNMGSEPNTRTLYDFDWESDSDDALEGEIDGVDWDFELSDIEVDGDTFEANYSDPDGDEDFDFTRDDGSVNL